MSTLTMRQRFEDWANANGYVCEYSYGAYWDQDTQRAWRIWQAADEAAQVAYGSGGEGQKPSVGGAGEMAVPLDVKQAANAAHDAGVGGKRKRLAGRK